MQDKVNGHLYFFCHHPQHLWYPIFEEVYPPNKTIVITHSAVEKEVASSFFKTNLIFNVLEGFDPDNINVKKAIEYLSNFYTNTETLFWQDVQQDRWIYGKKTDEFAIKYGYWICNQLDNFFERYKPEVAIGEKNALAYRIFHHFSKRIGFPHYTLLLSRNFTERFYFEKDVSWSWEKAKKMIKVDHLNLSTEEEKEINQEINQIRKSEASNIGNKQLGYKKETSFKFKIKLRLLRIKEAFFARNNPRSVSISEVMGFYKLPRLISSKIAKTRYNALAKFNLPEEYALYLLHVQPEYTIDGLGSYYKNQIELIRNIASLLPPHLKLVVKEHKPAFGKRSFNYYKKIEKINNVVLVDISFKGNELVDDAEIIFTVTGTVGIEGIVKQVPVVAFGNIFFVDFEGICKVESYKELKRLIPEILKSKREYIASEKSIFKIMSSLYKGSYVGKVACYYYSETFVNNKNNKKKLKNGFRAQLEEDVSD